MTKRHARRNPYRGVPSHLRRKVLARDDHTCQQCGDTGTEVDHIINVAAGGTNDLDNLRALCPPCHERKTRRETKLGHQRRFSAGYHPGEQHPGLI